VEHLTEIVGICFLLLFAATMFYQGTMILKGKHGYSHMDHKTDSANMRKRIEELLKNKLEG